MHFPLYVSYVFDPANQPDCSSHSITMPEIDGTKKGRKRKKEEEKEGRGGREEEEKESISSKWYHAAQQERERESCLLYTSPSPRDRQKSRMPSSA